MKQIYMLITFFSFYFLSCKSDKKNDINEKIEKYDIYNFQFPDTVLLNKRYNGFVYYKSSLDTMVANFNENEKSRFAYLLIKKTKYINYSFKDLDKFQLDTIPSISNGKFLLLDIRFDSVGVFYIDGKVSDIVLVNINKKDNNGENLIRMINNDFRVTHKVVVIDSLGLSR